jgi:hypothetical protein
MIGRSLSILWRDWPKDMQLANFDNNSFALSGICPHCGAKAAFVTVTPTYEERSGNWPTRIVGAARCIACNDYILAALKSVPRGTSGIQWEYEFHYPLGSPNDAVPDAIPGPIKSDFQEARRCRFIKAYNATAEMCRRALESSCLEQGAKPDLVLAKMIDQVHAQGKITNLLREVAHKIKLGGNRAAHPSDRELTEEDADAVLDFTFEYFQNIYVIPAALAKHTFDKPKKKP